MSQEHIAEISPDEILKDFAPGIPYEVHTTAILLDQIPNVTPIILGANIGPEYVSAPSLKLHNVSGNEVVTPLTDEAISDHVRKVLENCKLKDKPLVTVINTDHQNNHNLQHYIGVVLRPSLQGPPELLVIDPLGSTSNPNPDYKRAVDFIINGFKEKFGNDIKVTINPEGTVYQRDGVSCAPVCLANVEAIAKGEFINTNQFGITATRDGMLQFPKDTARLRTHQKATYLASSQAPGTEPTHAPETPPGPTSQKTKVPDRQAVLDATKILGSFHASEQALEAAKRAAELAGKEALLENHPTKGQKQREEAKVKADADFSNAKQAHKRQLDIQKNQQALSKAEDRQKLADQEMAQAILKPSTLSADDAAQYRASLRMAAAEAAHKVAIANFNLLDSLKDALEAKSGHLLSAGTKLEQIEPILAAQNLIEQRIKEAEKSVVSTNDMWSVARTSADKIITPDTKPQASLNAVDQTPANSSTRAHDNYTPILADKEAKKAKRDAMKAELLAQKVALEEQLSMLTARNAAAASDPGQRDLQKLHAQRGETPPPPRPKTRKPGTTAAEAIYDIMPPPITPRRQAQVPKMPEAQIQDIGEDPFYTAVRNNPGVRGEKVTDLLKKIPEQEIKPTIEKMQALAIDLSEKGDLIPASNFIQDPPNTGWRLNPNLTSEDRKKINGPIFMSRIDESGNQIKDRDNKPVYDVLYYDKGVLDTRKSFIAPDDDVPPGSRPTVDKATREMVIENKPLAAVVARTQDARKAAATALSEPLWTTRERDRRQQVQQSSGGIMR